MLEVVLVAIGGGVGATTRYLTSNWAARISTEFPLGTLLVNVVGCFLIGVFMVLTTERISVSPHWRLFIAVGFLGGLTTFSSFSYETLRLVQEADIMRAFYNVGLNLLVGFFATWLGMGTARLL